MHHVCTPVPDAGITSLIHVKENMSTRFIKLERRPGNVCSIEDRGGNFLGRLNINQELEELFDDKPVLYFEVTVNLEGIITLTRNIPPSEF